MSSSNWRDSFVSGRPSGRPMPPPIDVQVDDADELTPDLAEYKPWTLARGRSRPAMMLELRRFEPRSGMWMGWQLSYPTLIAAEYTGDRMLSLDFGQRQFMLEGRALDELARHIQLGSVIAIQEHSPALWPVRPVEAFVSSIQRIGGS